MRYHPGLEPRDKSRSCYRPRCDCRLYDRDDDHRSGAGARFHPYNLLMQWTTQSLLVPGIAEAAGVRPRARWLRAGHSTALIQAVRG